MAYKVLAASARLVSVEVSLVGDSYGLHIGMAYIDMACIVMAARLVPFEVSLVRTNNAHMCLDMCAHTSVGTPSMIPCEAFESTMALTCVIDIKYALKSFFTDT